MLNQFLHRAAARLHAPPVIEAAKASHEAHDRAIIYDNCFYICTGGLWTEVKATLWDWTVMLSPVIRAAVETFMSSDDGRPPPQTAQPDPAQLMSLTYPITH